jgi:hypothetical protein
MLAHLLDALGNIAGIAVPEIDLDCVGPSRPGKK